MFRRILPLTLLPLVLAATACADGRSVAGPVPTTVSPGPSTTEPTAPPTTEPAAAPTTEPPAPPTTEPAAPPTTNPPPGVLPTTPVAVDDGVAIDLDQLYGGADAVVVVTVTDEQPIVSDRQDANPPVSAYVGLRFTVDEVLAGDADDEIRLAWHAYALDADGEPIATNVFNGVPVPRTGDRLVLFLRTADEQFASTLGGFPTHAPVMLDGVGFLDGDAVVVTDDSASIAVLHGLTIDEIRAAR